MHTSAQLRRSTRHDVDHHLGRRDPIEQIAVLVYGAQTRSAPLGGGRIQMIGELMQEVREGIAHRKIQSSAVPEQFVILRSLQFAATYWRFA